MQRENKVFYYDTNNRYSPQEFGDQLYQLLHKELMYRPLVFLCIGSDRATGDCLGPLLGHKLDCSQNGFQYDVYGTLQNPVHAKNLTETMESIHAKYNNPLIVAIDASLGKPSHVGYYTLGKGSLKPGAGVNKELPSVGDYYITGIVNMSGLLDQMLLQTTRLHTVMFLSDRIYEGIRHFFHRFNRTRMISYNSFQLTSAPLKK